MFRDFMKRSAAKELESAGAALNKTPSVGMIEQSAAAAGHVLGIAAGGAAIGAGVNGYEYSQTGMGYDGSFSMAESVLSGAVAGAIGGGLVGSLGAKAAGKRANMPRERAETRYAKAISRAENRGLAGPALDMTAAEAAFIQESIRDMNRAKLIRQGPKAQKPPRSTQTAQMTQPLNPVNPTVHAPQPAGKKKKKRR